MTDDELLADFESLRLESLPHSDHVRLACLYLNRYDIDRAARVMGDRLLLFASSKGQPEKFHVTLTRAWLELVALARQRHPQASAADLIRCCPLLGDARSIERFYSRAVLNSARARTEWVPPDRAPLDATI